MATREDVLGLVRGLLERDPEGLYNDEIEDEEPERLLHALAATADERRSVLAKAATRRSQTFGGRPFPTSFIDFVATFGFSEIIVRGHAINLWMQQLTWEMGLDTPQANAFVEGVQLRGQPAVAYSFVDNPGDMPAYGFVTLLEESTGDGESLWLYQGWDLAWEDGITLAPMGRTFWDVAFLAFTGLADALYVPSAEFEGTLGRLRGTPASWVSQLEELARLRAQVQGLEASVDETYADAPFSWGAQLAQLDDRITRLRHHASSR